MSTFSLASVPGLAGAITLTENASGQAVAVEVKDPIVFLPPPRTLAMQAAHRRLPNGAHEVTLTAAGLGLALAGGHIHLQTLTVVLRFLDGGSPRWDSAAGGIQVSGDATWPTAQMLGLPTVALRVGYAHAPGASGRFTFTLANPPLALPLNVARLDAGEFSLELPADRPVARLSVAGAASLTASGAGQASQLLNQALGNAGNLRPVRGRYTVELGLQGGRLPDAAPRVGVPALQVDLDWPLNFNVPALPNLPNGLAVDLGLPTLHLPFDAGGPRQNAPWSLGFRDSAIRFPTINGFSGLRLDGSLLWESGVGNRFALAPTRGGSFPLPDILSILLARLEWGASPLALGQIKDAADASLPELDWQALFAGLVPNPLPNTAAAWDAFDVALRAALDAAVAAGIGVDRAFTIAFRAFADAPGAVVQRLWSIWFAIGSVADPLAALPGMLASLLASAPAACDRALRILFATPPAGFDPGRLFAPLIDFVGANLTLPSFELWGHVMVNAANHTPDGALPGVIAKVVSAILAAAWLQPIWAGFPGVALAALNAFFSGLPLAGAEVFIVFTVLLCGAASRAFLDFLRGCEPFAGLLHTFGTWLSTPLPELQFGRFLAFLQYMVFPPPGMSPEDRRAREERILCAANAQPLFGLFLAVCHLPVAFFSNRDDGLELAQRPVSTQAGRNVKTLPKGKYLILSDIHRDTQRDRLPPMRVGSIHHFANNKDLFTRVLDWADTRGFTVLEGGDCEELWFIRDPAYHLAPDPATGFTGFKKQLRETLDTHADVYEKLRKLHREGRYFRIFGNHDSYLRDPDMLAMLKAEMEKPVGGAAGPPFTVFDFFVIDGVKRMTESRIFETIGRDGTVSLNNLPQAIGLGMDARDYTKTCRMLVTHGHQWDFFNCDSNNWLGKLISNAVATPFDRAMDLAIDARGLALAGSPTVDFRDALASIFLFDNWPGREPSVKFAHAVQHLPNGARILHDGVMYRETVAAIMGTKFTAINYQPAGGGAEVTPQQSMADVQAGRLDLFEYCERHHSHHLCIGHTHNPQSQPYFRLLPFVQELPVFRDVMTTLAGFVPIKSQYFNSGTCGWMDGVVWGILIEDDTAPGAPNPPQAHQARLVFWTHNSIEPERMDWELSALDPAVKAAIAARFPAFHAPRDLAELGGFFQGLVGDLFANFGFDLGSGSERDRLKLTYPMPPEAMFPAMDRAAADSSPVVLDLSDADGRDPAQLADAVDKVQTFALGALMTAMGRGRTGAATARRDFVLRLPPGAAQPKRLEPLAAEMAALPGATASLALTAASLMQHLVEDFPRNLPFFGGGLDRLRPFERLALSPQPVVTAAMAILPLTRLAGPAANPLCQPMAFRAGFNGNQQLEFTLTVGA
jgi:hypothetical protein